MLDNYERIQLDMNQGPLNLPSASICDPVNGISPSFKNCSSVFSATVLCHAPEKGYIFLVQLDNDAIDTDSGASGDHYS